MIGYFVETAGFNQSQCSRLLQ